MKQAKLIGVGASCVLIATSLASAGTFAWLNALNGNWNDAARWELIGGAGSAPPGVGDIARFDLNSYYEITCAPGTTAVDALEAFDGTTLIQGPSTGSACTVETKTGIADVVAVGGTMYFGELGQPITVDVGDDTILMDNGTILVRYASSLITDSLKVGDPAFPTTGVNSLTISNSSIGAELSVDGATQIGNYGDFGELVLQHNAIGTLGGAVAIGGVASAPGSDGELRVATNADLTVNSAIIVGGGHATASGTVRVEGAGSTIAQTGASGLTLGGNTGQGSGALRVNSNGLFTTGTGNTWVRTTGGIYVGTDGSNTGQVVVQGTLQVDGGNLFVRPSNGLVLPTGATVNVNNGADVLFTAPYLIDGGRSFICDFECEFEMLGGGSIGHTTGNGTVEIIHSYFGANGPLALGALGSTGMLRIDAGSLADIGPVIYLGGTNPPGTTGILTIEGGSVATLGITNVWGMAPGTQSVMTVRDEDTEVTIQGAQLSVGHVDAQGDSLIRVADDATIMTTQGASNAGVVRVSPHGVLHVDAFGGFDADSEIVIDGGELRVDGNLNILPNSWIEFQEGRITGGGSINFAFAAKGTLFVHDTLAPGHSAGQLQFANAYVDMGDNSTIEIELGGLTAGSQHDVLHMENASLDLAGTLEVTLIDDFVPMPDDEFVIITVDNGGDPGGPQITGTFDTVNTPTPMDIVYSATEVRLITLPSCRGDIVQSATFNPPADGVVDGADLAYLLGEWGRNPGSAADFVDSATFAPPPDGVVDGADLAVLLGGWGVCE